MGEFFYPGFPNYVTTMEAWFFPEQVKAYHRAVLPDGKWRLCLGVLVYGDYVERFLKLCVPSLLAPGNITALPDPLIIIHTDAGSVPLIEAGLVRLRQFARVEIHTVPDEILEMVPEHPANKYWLLGGVHNLHMQMAKYQAHSYHMLMPDHVYGMGYFENLARLAKTERAIVQGGMSVDIETVGPIVQAAKGKIEPRQLAAIGVDNLHPLLSPYLMNGRTDWPPSLLLILVGKGSVHLMSPHMSIAYLSHDLLMRAPLRLFNTVDGQLPFFIPEDVEPYVPGPDDGMIYLELSPGDKRSGFDGGCTIDEFCARFWVMMFCTKDFERYFGLTTELRLPEGYLPPMQYMTDAEISDCKSTIRKAVSDTWEQVYSVLPPERRTDPLLRIQKRAA